MDIRDVKEEPQVVEGGMYLEKIYELQKVLVDHYVKIEGLPPYPISVNTKPSQIILKDFTGRVIEELAEGFESHLLIDELTSNNLYWSDEDGSSNDYQQMVNHLQNLNEEQADAMHFMTELMIYCNIQPDDIQAWIDAYVKKYNFNSINAGAPYVGTDGDVIANAIELGYAIFEGDLTLSREGVNLVKYIDEVKLKYLPGARYLSMELMELSEKLLWRVTYHINISRNCLKNKPWKQSGVMTDETLYQSKVVEAFVYMMTYFGFIGMGSKEIYYLYFKKNMVNQFRIKSNY